MPLPVRPKIKTDLDRQQEQVHVEAKKSRKRLQRTAARQDGRADDLVIRDIESKRRSRSSDKQIEELQAQMTALEARIQALEEAQEAEE